MPKMTSLLAAFLLTFISAVIAHGAVIKGSADEAKMAINNTSGKINLTHTEKTWLAKHNPIRVGISPVVPPLKFIEDGVIKGIEPDYLKLLSTYTGLEFEIVEANFSVLDEKVKAAEVDMFISYERILLLSVKLLLLRFFQYEVWEVFKYPLVLQCQVNNAQ